MGIKRCALLLVMIGLIPLSVRATPGRDRSDERAVTDASGRRMDEAGITVTQRQIETDALSLHEIQQQGLLVFSVQFNAADGYGDGPEDSSDLLKMGGRTTLQGNGTFLRVHGLDGQSCLECHSILSNASTPPVFGIGGVGGSASNALVSGGGMDATAPQADFVGRFINPPFLFGAGRVQLLGNEMTADLQALKRVARANPGRPVKLRTKGVDFGVLRFENGAYDYSEIEGIDRDLVVRPFGRKGEFPTIRSFDLAALQFHFGMQPSEVVGANIDEDRDGVAPEIAPGPISALEVFIATLPPPEQTGTDREDVKDGRDHFANFGCADCHRPSLRTNGSILGLRFPEVEQDPSKNVFYEVPVGDRREDNDSDSDKATARNVPLFADLKRHDMGPALAENFHADFDRFFTTARLWGVADTAPYMHDGRALTLDAAIRMHAGEAQKASRRYTKANREKQTELILFLKSLRTPVQAVNAHTDNLLR